MIPVRKAIAAASLAVAVGAGAFSAIRAEIEYLRDVPAKSHADAWSRPEAERMRDRLHGWFETYEGVRATVPEAAVVWGWINAEIPPKDRLEILSALRVALAPRILLALESKEFFDSRHRRLVDAGLETFVMESHPVFGGGERIHPLPAWAVDPALGEWTIAAEHADFTLRRLRPAR